MPTLRCRADNDWFADRVIVRGKRKKKEVRRNLTLSTPTGKLNLPGKGL